MIILFQTNIFLVFVKLECAKFTRIFHTFAKSLFANFFAYHNVLKQEKITYKVYLDWNILAYTVLFEYFYEKKLQNICT